MSVILVGDHGQLPPVKDEKMYSWRNVRYTDPRQKNTYARYKADAPKWGKAGSEAYDSFEDIFFLDEIMRIAGSPKDGILSFDDYGFAQSLLHRNAGTQRCSREEMEAEYVAYKERLQQGKEYASEHDMRIHDAHSNLLNYFRELQLRARDGELTNEDVGWMQLHMTVSERPDNFVGVDVKHLVTTKVARDVINLRQVRAMVSSGVPSMRIHAINSSKADAIDDDDFGLLNELILCIGARVMITKNLCVEHGLVNGTTGIVEDIIVAADGVPCAILVRVKRRTGTTDGYSGPCFLGTDEGGGDAIVAIHRWSNEVYDLAEKHTRRQFPFILAWALTVHKSQGLTLTCATFDPGDDEVHCGGTFTALTRVRHPMHFAILSDTFL